MCYFWIFFVDIVSFSIKFKVQKKLETFNLPHKRVNLQIQQGLKVVSIVDLISSRFFLWHLYKKRRLSFTWHICLSREVKGTRGITQLLEWWCPQTKGARPYQRLLKLKQMRGIMSLYLQIIFVFSPPGSLMRVYLRATSRRVVHKWQFSAYEIAWKLQTKMLFLMVMKRSH